MTTTQPALLTLYTPQQAARWLAEHVTGHLTADSRRVGAGDGFIAWPGAATDGREFVQAAIQQGATACLVEAHGHARFGFGDDPRIAVYENLKRDTGPIAAAWYGYPSQRLAITAITGTNGKTSIAWWLAHALSQETQGDSNNLNNLDNSNNSSNSSNSNNLNHSNNSNNLNNPDNSNNSNVNTPAHLCGLIGTLGVGPAAHLIPSGMTTPDPVTLQASLRDFVQAGAQYCVMEASSIGIAEHRLAGTTIKVAAYTNLTQDHLDYHGSMEIYWQAKRELFDWPQLQAAVINLDDPRGSELAQYAHSRDLDVWTISVESDVDSGLGLKLNQQLESDPKLESGLGIGLDLNLNSDSDSKSSSSSGTIASARLIARNLRWSPTGVDFVVVEDSMQLPLHAFVAGVYNVSNLLIVIGCLRALGFSLEQSIARLAHIPSVPGRMEPVALKDQSGQVRLDQPRVIVDYAHTPDALGQALKALRPLAQVRDGALWCVFGCGGNRDPGKRPLMGAAVYENADGLIVTSDNPRGEQPQTIIDNILAGITDRSNVTVIVDRSRAIADVIAHANDADVILIAGKGHEDYQEVQGVRYPFSDQEHARLALIKRAATKESHS